MLLTARFVLLKVSLLMKRAEFGCNYSPYESAVKANDVVRQIKDVDFYFGQLARVETYIEGDEPKRGQAIELLNELTKRQPQRIESYIKLWQLYYDQGCYHSRLAS
jgi:predicted Zn-dependent protease